MTSDIETFVTWFDRVWSKREVTAIDAMLVPDGGYVGLASGEKPIGPAEFKVFHELLCRLMRDIEVRFDHHVQADGWIALMMTFSGKSVATGAPVSTRGSIHARVAQGRIVEAHNFFDFIKLFGDLGLMPSDAFVRCLQGEMLCG